MKITILTLLIVALGMFASGCSSSASIGTANHGVSVGTSAR